MQTILMGVAICLFGVVVTVLLVAVAFRQESNGDTTAEPDPTKRQSLTGEQFFLEGTSDPSVEAEVGGDPLLLKLQRHVRVEHEAAETFLRGPSVESLHAPPVSRVSRLQPPDLPALYPPEKLS